MYCHCRSHFVRKFKSLNTCLHSCISCVCCFVDIGTIDPVEKINEDNSTQGRIKVC